MPQANIPLDDVSTFSYTIGPDVRLSISTPASLLNSFSGIRPTDKRTVSTSYSTSVPFIGFPSGPIS